MNADSRFEIAFSHHQAGDFAPAEQVYRELLQEPGLAFAMDVRQLLGSLLIQTGRYQDAVPLLLRAISECPQVSSLRSNLAVAYSKLERVDLAEEQYLKILELHPREDEALLSLARLQFKAGKFAESASRFKDAINRGSTRPETKLAYAMALLKSQQLREAAEEFECLLKNNPDSMKARLGLGQVYLDWKELDQTPGFAEKAIAVWNSLVALEPQNVVYHNNLASVLKRSGDLLGAKQVCQQGLGIDPAYVPLLCNLGITSSALYEFEEACEVFAKAVDFGQRQLAELNAIPSEGNLRIEKERLVSALVLCYCQLAAAQNSLGDPVAALVSIEAGLKLSPQDAESRLLRGCLLLQEGRFEEGWQDYDFRTKAAGTERGFETPLLRKKSELAGKTVLVHAEQGLGDSIQFVRYLPELSKLASRVVFLCQRQLVPLLNSCSGIDQIVVDGNDVPPHDIQIPLLSVPGVIGSTVGEIPQVVPYILPEEGRVLRWRRRLQGLNGLKVGICWQGNPKFASDEVRSVPLREFSIFPRDQDLALVSLQKAVGLEQLSNIDFPVQSLEPFDAPGEEFLDTAAIIANLDLVISSDTAIAHLAGAMGKPVWLATSFMSEWRWGPQGQRHSPWYPTMRLYRQTRLRNWKDVFANMAADLAALAQDLRGQGSLP